MDLLPTIKAVQSKLGVTADGIAGPKTWAAISKALGIVPPEVVPFDPTLTDPRSEQNIDTLLPVVRPLARKTIKDFNEIYGSEFTAKITSGYRTYSEQAELYAKHKAGGPQAAPPGYSNHNFALAFDCTLFDHNGKPVWESPLYGKLGQIGKENGLDWGGDWHNSDEPHFEYRPPWARDFSESQALAEYRERHKEGTGLV